MPERRQGAGQHLRKSIKLRHAVALYISSVLGSGILILPGLAAKIAGPSSLIAWVFLSFASYPFAYTFATLSSRIPESGGVYSFAKQGYGFPAATVSAWLFALWFIAGAPAATLIAASYVAYVVPMTRLGLYFVAGGIMTLAFVVNYRGIRFSNTVQVIVVAMIVLLLVAAVAVTSGSVRMQNFNPMFPNGILPVGTAAALIFWSYLGYENVSNVAEEFANPQRDFRRSVFISVFLIGVLYISVAIVTIGTRAYEAGGSVAPFAEIFSRLLGTYGGAGTAALALFIIFATSNAYTAGMTRVIYAAAKDSAFPRGLAHVNPTTGVPDRSLIMLTASALIMLCVYYFTGSDLETALLIPSGAAIIVYIVGSLAGIRLLREKSWRRSLPWAALFISLAALPFVGVLSLPAVLVGGCGLAYGARLNRRLGVKENLAKETGVGE